MSDRKGTISRRNFIKAAGAVGLGSALGSFSPLSRANAGSSSGESNLKTVPKRPFGKTGVDVPILSLGGVLNASDLLVFRQAFKMGVTYWDTADSYGWGKNEKAIGKYFAKFPDDRKDVFLVTKASTSNPAKLTEKLNTSLERMNTTYGSETDDALKMTEKFLEKGFSAEQAKLKAVWENPNIASICSAMSNMTILQANVAAALDQKKLSTGDRGRMEQFAQRTAAGYCAGCADICESAVEFDVPISDIMRYSMYNCSYGDRETALRFFNALSPDVKANILKADYSRAERCCPQRIQIGRVLRRTHEELTPTLKKSEGFRVKASRVKSYLLTSIP